MIRISIQGARIAGIGSAVPAALRGLEEDARVFGLEAVQKVRANTGVQTRRAAQTLCASDLCAAAAVPVLAKCGVPPETVDGLLFVSQTPDYPLPATACSLHGRLGLSRSCAAFDVNLGCSGYVYGLYLAATLLAAGGLSRVLLLAGDTSSRLTGPQDIATAPLFGDAGTATLLVKDPAAAPLRFALGTDGTGAGSLIVEAGAFRRDAGADSPRQLKMDGAAIFTFTLKTVPPMVAALLESAGWEPASVNSYVFHQANAFIINHLAKRMKLPPEKVPLSIGEFGNTSSASIPLTMCEKLADSLSRESQRLVLLGFGVGLSWAGAAVEAAPMEVAATVEVEEAGEELGVRS
jgi:3-oxoacyl-[acyl-carrier-protein] synthase-3